MKVYALHDKAKKLWHVPYGYTFDENGESDWPNDQFTKRRIRDGDISTTSPVKASEGGQQEETRRRARIEHKSPTE